MKLLPAVAKGKAVIVGEDLRCQKPREDDPTKPCNKLIAKTNRYRQIAGCFLCERCKEPIEVRLVRVPAGPKQTLHDAGNGASGSAPKQYPLRFGETQDISPKEVSPK
jgi:hypothetical protein